MAVREARIQRRISLPAQLAQVALRPISPSRLVLALIVAAFVLAMVWVQQTQAIVRVGGEVQTLERRLEVLLQAQQDLRAQLASENDLPTVQRVAFTALDMREPTDPLYVSSQALPPGVSLDLPVWAAPSQRLYEIPWWEDFLRAISAKITSLRE